MPKSRREKDKEFLDVVTQNVVALKRSEHKDRVIDRDNLENIAEKPAGINHGFWVKDQDGKIYLLKKSGRFINDNTGAPLRSGDVSPLDMAKRSFSAVALATSFESLKYENGSQGLFPVFNIAVSSYNTKKPSNASKKGDGRWVKIYTASSKVEGELVFGGPDGGSTQEFLNYSGTQNDETSLVVNDLVYSAFLSVILLNLDIKFDNFVYPKGTNTAVAVDFEIEDSGVSPDVIEELDSTMKAGDNVFSHSSLRSNHVKNQGRDVIKRFYDKRLSTRHFAKLLERLDGDKLDLFEKEIWNNFHLFTFGSEEEKNNLANMMVARLRNAVFVSKCVQSFTQEMENSEDFSRPDASPKSKKVRIASDLTGHKIRDVVASSKYFKEHIKDNKFLECVNDNFSFLIDNQKEVLEMVRGLKEMELKDQDVYKQEIQELVDVFNSRLRTFYQEIKGHYQEMREKYSESQYVMGSNGVAENQNDVFNSIFSKMKRLIVALNRPFSDPSSSQSPAFGGALAFFDTQDLDEDASQSDDDNEKEQKRGQKHKKEKEESLEDDIVKLGGFHFFDEQDEHNLSDQLSPKGKKKSSSSNLSSSGSLYSQLEDSVASDAIDWEELPEYNIAWGLNDNSSSFYAEKLNYAIGDLEKSKTDFDRVIYKALSHLNAYDTLNQVKKEYENKRPAINLEASPRKPSAVIRNPEVDLGGQGKSSASSSSSRE